MKYADAGVNIAVADDAKQRIRHHASRTFTPGVLGGIGSFFALDRKKWKEPVLVSSADGVGTKLKVAMAMGVHSTVGGDLVNHCINDILVQGAEPLFFLDYLAMGKLDPQVVEQLVDEPKDEGEGIVAVAAVDRQLDDPANLATEVDERARKDGLAEVELCFSNDGALQVPWSEIAVSRRLYRTGESEYYLNKTQSRLRDILDLFAGSGAAGIEGGLTIALTKMDRILDLDRANLCVVVQPGIINAELKRAVAEEGLFYPPDPASYPPQPVTPPPHAPQPGREPACASRLRRTSAAAC